MQGEETRKARSDARENRARLVEVARTAFAAEGLDVTLREIARRAGLGIATLHRHFACREDLVRAAFAEQVAACTAAADAALADPDPWRGLRAVLDEICTRQALDRGFTAALLSTGPVFAEERAHNLAVLDRLVERARASGALRPDFERRDLRLVLAATARVPGATPAEALVEARRLVALLVRGMAGGPVPEPLPGRRG